MRSKSLVDTEHFAKTVLESISAAPHSGAAVLALSGELGSGKTAFVKALAKELGVEETVTSPTFVIEKIYKLSHSRFKNLVHVDAYRLESAHELEVLGFKELLQNAENLVAIEWPERVA